METDQNILVICDCFDRKAESVNRQLLGKARELAKENEDHVVALYWGNKEEAAKELLWYGANEVAMVDETENDYIICSKIICELVTQYHAALVLFPGTDFGKMTAGTVASEMEAGLIADCIEIQRGEEGKYIFQRAALSSTIIANIVCDKSRIQMCTVKPNVFTSFEKREKPGVEVIKKYDFDVESDLASYIDILEATEKPHEECDLTKSKVIFAVGRGVSEEDFESIKKIASHYKAEVGGTRIMVEKGFITKSRQIGQSGINVAPDLYLAFGISGANQHIAGILNAKKIIAVNQDENAPIFQYADFGIVSDVHDIVTELLNEMEE